MLKNVKKNYKEGVKMELSRAQKRIINSRPNGIKVIKGEKGCGKTISAMNRAFKLMQSYCASSDDEILILAKEYDALKELENIHESILNSTVVQKSFFDDENKNKLEMNDINSIILSYFKRYNNSHKTDYCIADLSICRSIMEEAVIKAKEKCGVVYKNVKFFDLDYIDFFMDEVKWIKECCFRKEHDYLNADRSSRINALYGKEEKTVKMRKNSKSRECVLNVMKEYNRILREKNFVDFEDAAFYAAEECRDDSDKRYTHIIVDETEKFSRVELEIIDILYNKKVYSSITFVVDSDNLENSSGWINKKRKFSSLGYNVKGKTVKLKEKLCISPVSNSEKEHRASKKTCDKKKRRSYNKNKRNTESDEIQYTYSLLNLDVFNFEEKSSNLQDEVYNEISMRKTCDKNDDAYGSSYNYNKETSSEDLSINKNVDGDSKMEFETVKYIDLNRNVCHEFISDFYESGEVYTSDDNFKNKVEDVVNVPVFSEIAAGSPILMNDEVEYSCNIPKSWVRSSKDLFILKIKGDSMVNKNINDGDHVIINKGRYPSANDVVAVEIEGEATLKTFKTKGRQIILKPENDKYDPIILNGEQECSILGVAVGILKNLA